MLDERLERPEPCGLGQGSQNGNSFVSFHSSRILDIAKRVKEEEAALHAVVRFNISNILEILLTMTWHGLIVVA